MVAYRQIPKSVLIHTITIDGIDYNHVRIDNLNKWENTGYGRAVIATHLMFVDIKNTPKYTELKEKLKIGNVITWQGIPLSIGSIETLFTNREHHLEVELK